jgi:hypothetical protein
MEQREKFLADSGFGNSKMDNLERPKVDRPRIPYEEALQESIQNAKQRGFDYRGLAQNRTTLAPYIFREVLRRLPNNMKECLQMYCIAASSFDFDYGADMVFVLDKALVRIDLTINFAKQGSVDENHFIMSPCNIDTRSLALFAVRVAKRLLEQNMTVFGPGAT